MSGTAKRPAPIKGRQPYRDQYGDPIPCLVPGKCPCIAPCHRVQDMIERGEVKS